MTGAICRACYGRELSLLDRPPDEQLPRDGWPIGMISATSIGERGTQLAMRTFHSGGRSGADFTTGLPRICALLAGRVVPVAVTGTLDAWGGDAVGANMPVVPRSLRMIPTLDRLVQAFMLEMYSSYDMGDVDPKHFEVLLAALLDEEGRYRGLRETAQRRIGPLEQMAFGDTAGVIKRTVKKLGSPEVVKQPTDTATLDRLFGRRRPLDRRPIIVQGLLH